MPEPTLFLLYLFLHALKHFVHSGVGIRQLCDISLFAGRFGKDIDWQKVKREVTELGSEKWYADVLAVLRDRLALDAEAAGIPADHFPKSADLCPLLDDITSGAVFGAYDMARHHSGNITLGAVESGTKSHTALHTLFPPLSKASRTLSLPEKIPLSPARGVGKPADQIPQGIKIVGTGSFSKPCNRKIPSKAASAIRYHRKKQKK